MHVATHLALDVGCVACGILPIELGTTGDGRPTVRLNERHHGTIAWELYFNGPTGRQQVTSCEAHHNLHVAPHSRLFFLPANHRKGEPTERSLQLLPPIQARECVVHHIREPRPRKGVTIEVGIKTGNR